MKTIADRFPNVAFNDVPSSDFGWHGCPDHDGDDTRSTARIVYRRFGGTHEIECCGLCLGSELVYLHQGNPLPMFVTVAEVHDEHDEIEVAA